MGGGGLGFGMDHGSVRGGVRGGGERFRRKHHCRKKWGGGVGWAIGLII